MEPAEPADPVRSEPDREDPERAEPEKVGPERPERVEPMPSEPSGGRESATERPEERRSWWRRMFGGSSRPRRPEGPRRRGAKPGAGAQLEGTQESFQRAPAQCAP